MAGTRSFEKDFETVAVTGGCNGSSLFVEMQKRNIDNSQLDAIGKTLVKQAFERRPDVEKIVADPYLFARIRTRISAGDMNSTSVASPLARFFGLRTAIGGAVAAIAITTVFGLSFLNSSDDTVTDNYIQFPPQQTEVARPLDPPQVNVDKLSQSRATNFETPRVEKAVTSGSRSRKQPPAQQVEFDADGEFYPVAYSGDIEETVAGGRVIRVDMNRSSLFALGINLPLENDAETIKADLLVGRDGVTRAVRLVK